MKYLNHLVYGTWGGAWGKKNNFVPKNKHENICLSLLKYALSNGITEIDTAELYGNGYAETIIGKIIMSMNRREILINSKVSGHNHKKNQIKAALENSLKRLHTDYIDVYFLHWYEEGINLEESLNTMMELKDKGLIRRIGVSNFNYNQIIESYKIIGNNLEAVQLEFNYLKRNNGKIENVENQIAPFCQKHNITFYAYNPLDSVLDNPPLLFRELSVKYNKTIAQIGLNWILSQNNIKVIFGTSNINHLQENLDIAFDIEEFR